MLDEPVNTALPFGELGCPRFNPLTIAFHSGPAGGPSHKMQPFSSPKGGSWSQAFHAWTVETGDKPSLFVSTVFCGEVFGKNRGPYTLMSHTKMSIVFGRGRSTNYSAWEPAR